MLFVPPSAVEQSVKLKSGLRLKILPKTVSLEQVKTLKRELEQEDVCDMDFDLAEVRWQESDVEMLNVFAQDLETAVECLPAREVGDEDVNMRGDEHDDGSDVEEQVPMEEGGEHDEAAPEGEVHSRHDVERVKRALRRLHTNLGHQGVKEMVRVLKHGRASELAVQEARRMHCDICTENVQPKLPRRAIPRQVLDFNERVRLDILSFLHWSDATRSVKCLNIVCHGTLFQMIIPLWSWTTPLDVRSACREGWQRWARDPKQVVLDLAGENLHDIFLDPLELNSVETEVTAAESPWQAGMTEANGRAFKMVFKKMLDSTQPRDKGKYEECVDATVLVRNFLLRIHGFSPCQHVFGRVWFLGSWSRCDRGDNACS